MKRYLRAARLRMTDWMGRKRITLPSWEKITSRKLLTLVAKIDLVRIITPERSILSYTTRLIFEIAKK